MSDGDDGAYSDWVGEVVVVDTATPLVYIGTLIELLPGALELAEVDVHDCSEGKAGKELYVIESAKHGVKVNRRRCRLLRRVICSISRLEDVVVY